MISLMLIIATCLASILVLPQQQTLALSLTASGLYALSCLYENQQRRLLLGWFLIGMGMWLVWTSFPQNHSIAISIATGLITLTFLWQIGNGKVHPALFVVFLLGVPGSFGWIIYNLWPLSLNAVPWKLIATITPLTVVYPGGFISLRREQQ